MTFQEKPYSIPWNLKGGPITNQYSTQSGNLLSWLVTPLEPNKFFKVVWQKKPMIATGMGRCTMLFKRLYSFEEFERTLSVAPIIIGNSVKILNAVAEEKETSSLNGNRLTEKSAKKLLLNHSMALLFESGQHFTESIQEMKQLLQEIFVSDVRINILLVPGQTRINFSNLNNSCESNSSSNIGSSTSSLSTSTENSVSISSCGQNADRFIIQLEGRCFWFTSSSEKHIKSKGEAQSTLLSGHMLYVPSGYHLQCENIAENTFENVGVCLEIVIEERKTWFQYLQTELPMALCRANIEEGDLFQKRLPVNMAVFEKSVTSKSLTMQRRSFEAQANLLLRKISDYL